jgi:hypothetical protein
MGRLVHYLFLSTKKYDATTTINKCNSTTILAVKGGDATMILVFHYDPGACWFCLFFLLIV